MTLTRADGTGLWDFLEKQGIAYAKEDFPWLTADNPPKISSILDLSEYMQLTGWTEAVGFFIQRTGEDSNIYWAGDGR